MNGCRRLSYVAMGAAFFAFYTAQCFAAGVPLTGAASTYTRLDGQYTAANAIDGNLGGPFGWALDGTGESYTPQAAMFATTAPLNTASLNFGMFFTTCCGEHQINEFRISVTQDAVPSFGGSWTPLQLTDLSATTLGTYLLNVPDNRVRVVGPPKPFDRFGSSAAAPFGGITGFRLETLPYDRRGTGFPANGAASNGNFVLSEFVVDDANPVELLSGVNLAAGAVASTNYVQWPGFPVSNIVDGNRNSLTHVIENPPVGLHYDINLGRTVLMDRIDIFPRQDGCCQDRLRNYRVSVHEDLNGAIGNLVWSADMHTDNSNALNPDSLIAAMNPGGTFAGQWIRISSLANPVPNYALQIGEVEVYGDAPVPPAPLNVALGKTTTGDTYPGSPFPGPNFGTSRAVDGSTATFTHSYNNVLAFLQVDLEGIYDLTHVELVNRADGCCPERLDGAVLSVLDANFDTLYVSNPIVGLGVGGTLTFNNSGVGFDNARYIRVDQVSPDADSYLSISELRAFGVLVPEPSSAVLAALGLIGAVAFVRRRV